MSAIVAHHVVVPAADYAHVNIKLISSLPATKSLRRWAGILSAVGVIAIPLNVWQRGPDTYSNVLTFSILLVICFTYLFFGNALIRRYLLRSYAKEHTPARYPTDYTFTAESISGHNELSNFTVKWAGIQRADLLGHWLLLYPTSRSCYWVDLNLLEPTTAAADLQSLLVTHRIPVQTLAA
ncbi:MAG: hypothetical protein EOO37_02965 [Cytophagaceae bacterium]|nr:MAG: hypothetical protein EOO37_02965 [Cytophagaceae bacterium]